MPSDSHHIVHSQLASLISRIAAADEDADEGDANPPPTKGVPLLGHRSAWQSASGPSIQPPGSDRSIRWRLFLECLRFLNVHSRHVKNPIILRLCRTVPGKCSPSHVSHHKSGRQALHLAGRQPGTKLPTNIPYMGHERGIGLFAVDAFSGRIHRVYGFIILRMLVKIKAKHVYQHSFPSHSGTSRDGATTSH